MVLGLAFTCPGERLARLRLLTSGVQCQHVRALLESFAWPRKSHGHDRGSAYSCDSLDKTADYPGRNQFAHADAPPEPKLAGKRTKQRIT
jgi:hypothetical protein